MEFSLQLQSLSESNGFLRCLWAEMRREFGKLSWLYSPIKIGPSRLIRVGDVDIGADINVTVYLRYKKRSEITGIRFANEYRSGRIPLGDTQHVPGNIADALTRCIENAKERYRSPRKIDLTGAFNFNPRFTIADYIGRNLRISSDQNGIVWIAMSVVAFDIPDAEAEAFHYEQPLLDLLATFTNCGARRIRAETEPPNEWLSATGGTGRERGNYLVDADWLEGHPTEGARILLTEEQFVLLDDLMSGSVDLETPHFRAASHYNEALKLHTEHPNQHNPIVNTLLVSALETAATIDMDRIKSCSECGQSIYKISKRVKDLVGYYLGDNAAKMVADFYQGRSKYLHEGIVNARVPFTGRTRPILDPGASNGMVMPKAFGYPHNLVEFTGYILRQVLQTPPRQPLTRAS